MGSGTERIKVATGHNNAAGFVQFAYFEPWLSHQIPGLFRVSMDSVIVEDGNRSAPLIFGLKVPNKVKVDALSKTGLTSATYALGTVRLPSNKDRTSYSNFNCTFFYDHTDEYERRGSGFTIQCLFLAAI